MDSPRIRQVILRYGLIGSAVTFYISAIGMVEAFDQRRLIGEFISLGQLLYALGAVGAGLLTARELRDHPPRSAFVASLTAGGLTSLLPQLLAVFIELTVVRQAGTDPLLPLREMFVNFSPTLVQILTFGLGFGAGNLALAVYSAALGGLGASFVLMREPWRLAFVNAFVWTFGLGVFSQNAMQITSNVFGRGLVRILFRQEALNPPAAAVIFVGAFLVALFRVHKVAVDRWQGLAPPQKARGRRIGLVLAILALVALPWIVGVFLSQALFLIGLYIMMGLGLNIVVGFAGLLDLGYVAFFAFGAYVMGILTSTGPLGISDLSFWLALPVCVLAGTLWGLLLGFPVLRMRGDYLAIVTLGFGEIIRILATSDWLAPIEGGPQGVLHIPNPVLFGFELDSPQTMYYLVILGSLLAVFVTVRLRDSRLGRQWMAMREDEDVAEAMGINLISTKLLAFAIGAAFSAMAGGIFASRLSNIFPHSFNLLISINALALIIVGGLGSIPGVIVGAIVLVGLPELLREFTEYRLLMYGLVLILVMLLRPEGFLPEAVRKRELHAGEELPGEERRPAAAGAQD